ncbi:Uncharacterised protein [Dorea longicatena]|jgi:predicted transcriptional regulator|uniref:Uncharacterized protein n=1 Tax=Dorea longicatena TaxID=88431 RepID=A0A173RI49_9FIRM|nr:helix-turn-helix domain-containing protein [Dorea longicatena]CUM77660.1 Uncharacterised protein [Dorea longicatena]
MTGKTMMPDNFDEYFEKWLARKITQKEIATELRVSQSVVSNWIIQFRKDTGKDRDYIKTDAFKDALKGYENDELSTRQAGRMLGITHTGFRKLVMKAQEQQKSEEQKNSAAKEDAPKKEYGIDQLMANLSDETPETVEDGPGDR